MKRLGWALGVIALVLSVPAAFTVASALPLGYDFRAYWLAAQHIVTGARVYEQVNATLGQPDEFHYLPVVAVPFIVTLLMPLQTAIWVWLVTQVALAAGLGVWLVRQLPSGLRLWAAAGYVFFLPMVLEYTLGNVDLICLVLALLAWRWRSRPSFAIVPYAGAVGIKFLMLSLIPGGIGFVLFVYGKKQERWPQLVAGLALMVYPYFTPGVPLLVGVGALICGG